MPRGSIILADLEAQIAAFVADYNHRRYHERIGNLSPGRRLLRDYRPTPLAAPTASRVTSSTNEPDQLHCSLPRNSDDGAQRKILVRLAEQDGRIYLNLADEFWRCIEISANGWRIAEDPPVRFRRSAGMQPLPLPLRGGSIEALAPFLNLVSENDFVLVVAWLLGALRAGGL